VAVPQEVDQLGQVERIARIRFVVVVKAAGEEAVVA